MEKSIVNQKIIEAGVVAILRSSSSEHFVKASEALIEGGINAIEVTLTTPGALASIRELAREFQGRILLGVGSILDPKQAAEAVEAGACYVITPVVRPQVIAYCNQNKVSILSGAYTPTEALNAFEAGADFIKIFPAETLGIKFIKGLLAPLPHLPLVPTGGVDEHNVADFIKVGCKAVGAGSSLVSQEILKTQNWKELTEISKRFVNNIKTARS